MRFFRLAILVAMLGLAGAIAAGFFGFVHPAFDTFANFRLHFSVALIALAAVWSFRCSRMPAIVFALIGLAGVALSAPGLPLAGYQVRPSGGEKVYRLFSMNLLWDNPTPERVMDAISASDADILFLTEASANWQDDFTSLRGDYPYFFHCAEWHRVGGSVILSRFFIRHDRDFCGDYASLGLTTLLIGNKVVTAGVAHLRWPWPASGPRQIDALEPRLAATGANALIAGDFNSVTWSYGVRRFAAAGGLHIVTGIGPTWGPTLGRAGHGLQWPQRLGLPIDNAMTRGAIRVISTRRLAPAGSDHLPLLIEFVVR